MTKVELRPVDTKKWHGKSGEESFSQPKTVEALYSESIGGYDTNLTPEEEEKYSKLLGKRLDNRFEPDAPHPTWSDQSMWIKLLPHTQFFDISIPVNYVKVKILKSKSIGRVANSMDELEKGMWPGATHVIYDEQEDVATKATKAQMRSDAAVLASKMSPEGKAAMVQILSGKTVRSANNDLLTVEIDELIANDSENFLKYGQMGREEVTIRAQVLEMLDRAILTKEGSAVYYMSEMIGRDYEAAVSWFKDPNNTKMKVAILEKLNK